MIIDRTVKNINRLRQVINILIKYSFEDVVTSTALSRLISTKRRVSWTRDDKPVFEYNRWERIRMVIEELGPTFIKLAQLLSNRPDILPKPLIQEFEKLQSDVPPFNINQARSIIEKELGKSIEDAFVYFDVVPVGAASIGQAHRARLKGGEDVVIKVQRPGVREKVTTDLALLREFVRLTENYFKRLGILNPLDIVDTFEEVMQNELDYKTEARSVEQFRRVYRYQSDFYIPKAYRDISTSKVLINEFVSGCKITDIAQLEAWGINRKHIAERMIDIYMKQIFEVGYFHADPHPGNVLVRPNGTIALIDFGMVGKVTRQQKYAFSELLISLIQRDARRMATSLRRLAVNSEIEDLNAFENDLYDLIQDFIVLDVGDMNMNDLTGRLQKIMYNYKLEIHGSVFLIFRALAILEGIGKTLYPDFKTFEYIKPYGLKLIAEQYSAKNVRAEAQYTISQILSLLTSAPIDIKYILKKIRGGKYYTHTELHGLEPLVRSFDNAINRLIYTFLIIALVIGAALVISSNYATHMSSLFGMPIVSTIALMIAAFLSIMLIVNMIRHRNGN